MLYLVPSPLSQTTPHLSVLAADLPKIQSCKIWLVENAKPARAALSIFSMPAPIRELELLEIGKMDSVTKITLLKKCANGEPIGLMSDAGCPGIADPGSEIVILAHSLGCAVFPLVGPSSILLALMASGLNGQNFHFHGYPPLDLVQRKHWIEDSEKQSARNKTTQIVIETPFRNDKLLEALLNHLQDNTSLCLALDLTGNNQMVACKPIAQWKKAPPKLGKEPCLFLWLAN